MQVKEHTRDHPALVLTDSLTLSRAHAATIADHLRAQRDEITSRIRFGLVALNGASAVATLTLLGTLGGQFATVGVAVTTVIAATVAFVLGVLAGGWSLQVHQTHLITAAGEAGVRTALYGRAIDLSRLPSDEGELGRVLAQLREQRPPEASYSTWAIHLQHGAGGLWSVGALSLVFDMLGDRLPQLASVLHLG